MRGLAIAALVAVVVASLNGQTEKVRIFVGAQVRDGFVDADQGILDSIKDIQDQFRRSRQFTVVKSRDDATVVLDVVARRIAGSSGSVGVPIGTTTMFLPIKRRAIDSVLHVGAYEKSITSEDENNDQWRAAARKVIKDVTAWVNANRERLSK